MTRFIVNSAKRLQACNTLFARTADTLRKLKEDCQRTDQQQRLTGLITSLYRAGLNIYTFNENVKGYEKLSPGFVQEVGQYHTDLAQLSTEAITTQHGAFIAMALYDLLGIIPQLLPDAATATAKRDALMEAESPYWGATDCYETVKAACAKAAETGFDLSDKTMFGSLRETNWFRVRGVDGQPIEQARTNCPDRQGLADLVSSAHAILEHAAVLGVSILTPFNRLKPTDKDIYDEQIVFYRGELAKLKPLFTACEPLFSVATVLGQCLAKLNESELAQALRAVVEIG